MVTKGQFSDLGFYGPSLKPSFLDIIKLKTVFDGIFSFGQTLSYFIFIMNLKFEQLEVTWSFSSERNSVASKWNRHSTNAYDMLHTSDMHNENKFFLFVIIWIRGLSDWYTQTEALIEFIYTVTPSLSLMGSQSAAKSTRHCLTISLQPLHLFWELMKQNQYR